MFYLNLFFSVLIKNPIRSLCFVVFGFALSMALTQTERLQKSALKNLPQMGGEPHFFALIDKKVNSESVRRKLMELPGVKAVRNVKDQNIAEKMKTILGDIGVDLPTEITANVSGLKVSFDAKLEERSQKLIKKYITRLTGEEKVTIGPTIEANKKSQEWLSSFQTSFKVKFGTLILVLGSILYLVFGIALGGELGKEAYLIEQFSRRRNVIEVTAGIGFFTIAALMVAPSIVLGSVSYLGLAVFFSLTMMFYLLTIKRGWRAH